MDEKISNYDGEMMLLNSRIEQKEVEIQSLNNELSRLKETNERLKKMFDDVNKHNDENIQDFGIKK